MKRNSKYRFRGILDPDLAVKTETGSVPKSDPDKNLPEKPDTNFEELLTFISKILF